jgi:hypothetical protein
MSTHLKNPVVLDCWGKNVYVDPSIYSGTSAEEREELSEAILAAVEGAFGEADEIKLLTSGVTTRECVSVDPSSADALWVEIQLRSEEAEVEKVNRPAANLGADTLERCKDARVTLRLIDSAQTTFELSSGLLTDIGEHGLASAYQEAVSAQRMLRAGTIQGYLDRYELEEPLLWLDFEHRAGFVQVFRTAPKDVPPPDAHR